MFELQFYDCWLFLIFFLFKKCRHSKGCVKKFIGTLALLKDYNIFVKHMADFVYL